MTRRTDRSPPEIPWPRLLARAEEHFGVRRLRPGQRELIEAALRRQRVVGLLRASVEIACQRGRGRSCGAPCAGHGY